MLVVTFAEDSAVEINAASQRQYVGVRSAYLADELVYSVDRHLNLADGSLTWLNSTDLVRCLLRQSAYSLLSTHYAVVYGGATGWDDLPLSQHWDWGAVSSWLPDGWVEAGKELPDDTQIPGSERPPKWQGDYCTPFTYSFTHFAKAKGAPGSIGRFASQDNIYFTANCFSKVDDQTELDPSFFRNNPRLRRFTDAMLAGECYGFRDDIILCAPDGEAAADRRWPLDPTLSAALEALSGDDAVKNCDPSLTYGCQAAKNRKRCADSVLTEADIRYLSNDQCSLLTKEEALKIYTDSEVSSLNSEVAARRRRAASSAQQSLGQPKVKDPQHGIADLNFYASKYEVSPTQGMPKPVDTTTRQGLHNFITFMTDHIVSLANERVGDLTENNKHYLAVHKYSNDDYESGREWTDALTKSMMAYIYEAVTRMHSNNTSTTAGYVVMLVVLALQFLLLGKRIEALMEDHAGMMTLIKRLAYEAGKLKAQSVLAGADADAAGNDAASNSSVNMSSGDSAELDSEADPSETDEAPSPSESDESELG